MHQDVKMKIHGAIVPYSAIPPLVLLFLFVCQTQMFVFAVRVQQLAYPLLLLAVWRLPGLIRPGHRQLPVLPPRG
jgi:hypothetical protein